MTDLPAALPAASPAAPDPGTSSVAAPPLLLSRREGGVLTLTFNRPQQRNPLSGAMIAALQAALDQAAQDHGLRVIVLAGQGPAFCAGHDLKEIRATEDPGRHLALFQACSTLMLTVARIPQVVIAAVGGIATAAGCQLVATADLAIASDTARFATPGVNIGLFCSTPMVAVTRTLAPKHAAELLFTGEMIDAATALRFGLVNRVVAPEMLAAEAAAWAEAIAARSPDALRTGKRARALQQGLEPAAAYQAMSEVMARSLASADAAEGIDAFLARRPPLWPGSA